MTNPLRVGVWLSATTVPRWIHYVLDQLRSAPYATLTHAYVVAPALRPASTLYGLYERLDAALFGRQLAVNAFSPTDATPLLANVPNVVDNVVDADGPLANANRVAPDVWLDLRTNAAGAVVWLPPLRTDAPVWTLAIGDVAQFRGSDGAWEVFRGARVSGSALLQQTDDPARPRILCQSWASTQPLSALVNRNHLYWKTAQFMPRQLAQWHRLGTVSFLADRPVPAGPLPVRYGPPTNPQALGIGLTMLAKVARKALHKLFFLDEWLLLTAATDAPTAADVVNPTAVTATPFRALVPPSDRFWADPFVVWRNGRHYVFLEELPYRTQRGHISVLEIGADGACTQLPQVVLARPYHLSYPFVFEHAGTTYMIPETADNQTVELYRCDGFPATWTFVRNLMQGIRAVDATPIWHDGRWWLFVSEIAQAGMRPWDELSIYFADTLFSDTWTPHPLNPVVSDVRRARPAGRIFWHDGHWYRPAQDCSGLYGYALRLHRITTLTETDYAEAEVSYVQPGDVRVSDVRVSDGRVSDASVRLAGVHTLNYAHGRTLLDGFRYRPRFW